MTATIGIVLGHRGLAAATRSLARLIRTVWRFARGDRRPRRLASANALSPRTPPSRETASTARVSRGSAADAGTACIRSTAFRATARRAYAPAL